MSAEDQTPAVAVHPHRISSDVDLNDPVEWSREPRHIPKVPGRKPVAYQAKLQDQKLNPKGLAPSVRKLRWQELFLNSRYGIDLIQSQRAATPPPAHVDGWVREIIAGGVPEDQREKFTVALHPGFRRWALFELVRNPTHGPCFRCISIFCEPARPGYLPPDLDTADKRWGHLRGRIGDYREPTQRDFQIIREQADLQLLGAKGVARIAEEREAQVYEEKNRVENDYVEDMLDYHFLAINRAANGGARQMSVPTVEVKPNHEHHVVAERNGYTVRARHGSRFASMLAAEEESALAARLEHAAEEARRAQAEKDREALFDSARAFTVERDHVDIEGERRQALQRFEAERRQAIAQTPPPRRKQL